MTDKASRQNKMPLPEAPTQVFPDRLPNGQGAVAPEQSETLSHIERNLATFLNLRASTLERHGSPRSELDQRFLGRFYSMLIDERNSRAEEIDSPEIKNLVTQIEGIFPFRTFGVFCIDGRVLPVVIFGFPGGYGGFIRIPAGHFEDFKQGEGDNLILKKGEHFADLIDNYFGNYPNNPLCQILDSHVGCAAREQKEAKKVRSRPLSDHGLLADVKRKKKKVAALRQYVDKHHPGKTIFPVQFSFDPNTGYGYMGLEKDEAISYAESDDDQGYSTKVLSQLIENNVVISTQKVAEALDRIFQERYFPIDWQNKYTESALSYWQNFEEMIKDGAPVLTDIKNLIRHVYNGEEKIDEAELHQRALLVLASAFNGYLQNRAGKVKTTHKEQCVVVQRQGHGPFNIDAFSVYPGPELVGNMDFSTELVIANRKAGRIKDITGTYETKEQFVDAPVPETIKWVVEEDIDPALWDRLHLIDWNRSDVIKRWDTMSDRDFTKFLQSQFPDIPAAFVEGLKGLRRKTQRVYDDPVMGELVFDGHNEILPMLVTKSRHILYLPYFIHQGTSEK